MALLFPEGHLLPPEGSPQLSGQPKAQTGRTAASGGGEGQVEAGAEKCCILRNSGNLFHGST